MPGSHPSTFGEHASQHALHAYVISGVTSEMLTMGFNCAYVTRHSTLQFMIITWETMKRDATISALRPPVNIKICGQQAFMALTIIGPRPGFHFDFVPRPRCTRPPRPGAPFIDVGNTVFAPFQLPDTLARPSAGKGVVEPWLFL